MFEVVSTVVYILASIGAIAILTYLLPVVAQAFYSDQNLSELYAASPGYKQWAIVTGSSSGIGKAIVERLAEQEINVILASLPDKLLDLTIEELTRRFPSVQFKKVGVNLGATDYNEYLTPVRLAVEQVVKENGEVRFLFSNAGFILPGLFSQRPLEQHLSNMNCNSTAAVVLTHAMLQVMIYLPLVGRKKALLAFTSSSAGFLPTPITSLYGSTKCFLTSFAAALSTELKASESGIDVVCVHPSPIQSNFYDNAKGVKLITAFQATAQTPRTIATTFFKAAGRCSIRDQGYFSIGSKLLLKVVDWNFMTEIAPLFMSSNSDFVSFMSKGLTVKQFKQHSNDTSKQE